MNIRTAMLALAVAAAIPATVAAGGPSTTGVPSNRANRILGTWLASGDVSGQACSPASSGPAARPAAYLVYHAGGTVTELPRLPSNAAQSARTFGVGSWYYQPSTDTYYVTFRFDWYSNGLLGGHQVVDREIRLDAAGNELSGAVVSVRYDLAGNEVYAQCGTGTARRL